MFLRTGTLVALSLVLMSGPVLAGNDSPTPISFRTDSCFNVDLSAYPVITFHGPEIIDISPFGPSLLEWSITVVATPVGIQFIEGTFAFEISKKLLVGHYTGFSLNPLTGDYVLGWSFDGGTGRFHKVWGSGQTIGVVDLTTYCAEYAFEGVLYDLPED